MKNVEIGKYVFDIVTSGGIEQQSLSKHHAYALNLYNKMRPIIDVAGFHKWSTQSTRVLLNFACVLLKNIECTHVYS